MDAGEGTVEEDVMPVMKKLIQETGVLAVAPEREYVSQAIVHPPCER